MIELHQISSLQDLKKAFAIRELVFVVEQRVPLAEEFDAYEDACTHYLATYGSIPCGVARWRTTDNGVKLERFAVLQEYRHKAVGSKILAQVLQDVKAVHPDKTIYLHAQVAALNFYKRQGFVPVGEMFSECDIDHFKMILNG